jgi:hypothetical protein
MSNFNYKNGISSTGAYQVSGRPWIKTATASGATTVEFPYVTKAFTIHSASANLDVYFNAAATSAEKITVTPAQCPQRFEIKCRTVILNGSADYQLYAELTGIEDGYNLTGSGVG